MNQVSVVLNCYNYGNYVVEAIESALDQTIAPLEVVVIDDGSTDETPAILERHFGKHPTVKVYRQRNGGQMSAFVAGMERAEGDVLCFLDADDLFERTHLESVTQAFEAQKESDFLFTAHTLFGGAEGLRRDAPCDLDLGFSLVATLKWKRFIGSATSTIAIRRSLAQTLLPVFREVAPRWRIRADDCLVYGASLAGTKKFFVSQPTVRYRVHGENGHFQRAESRSQGFAHGLRREAFVARACSLLGVNPNPPIGYVLEEFISIERPTRDQCREYSRLLRGLGREPIRRLKSSVKIHLHYRDHKADW
jgi:glycosyltransferase involved in cell wall biosynthesis